MRKIDQENQYKMKVDFISCYEAVFEHLDDEQIEKITKLNYPLEEVLCTILAELDKNTSLGCLKLLGEIVTSSESLTTKIVCRMP